MSIDLKFADFDSRLAVSCHHVALPIPGAGVGFVKAVRNDWKGHVRKGPEADRSILVDSRRLSLFL